MQKETWKDIKGYEGLYQVSDLGRIKSLLRKVKHGNRFKLIKKRILKVVIDSAGFETVKLSNNGISKTNRIHKLVAIAFLNHEPNKYKLVIDHKDNNPLNNNLENLQIITHRENCSKDKFRYNRVSKYMGVIKQKGRKNWRALIKINGKSQHLGCFKNELDAANAYQKKLKEIT